MKKLILVSHFNSISCSVLSVFGVGFLLILSAMYSTGVKSITEGPETPHDPKIAARTTFIAAILYVIFGGFCLCQAYLHSKVPQDDYSPTDD